MEEYFHARPEHIQGLPEAVRVAAEKVGNMLTNQEIEFDDVVMGLSVIFSLEDNAFFSREDFVELKDVCESEGVDILFDNETMVIRVAPVHNKLN